jgi:hypothetical protein
MEAGMECEGGCQCGAVRYRITGEALHNALCHCADCRASSGAPAVGWLAVKEEQLALLSGSLATYTGKTGSQRQFCPVCGTGLFFRNEDFLPGIVDVQSATLDKAAQFPPGAQIQCAERLGWMTTLAQLPEFARFPGPE